MYYNFTPKEPKKKIGAVLNTEEAQIIEMLAELRNESISDVIRAGIQNLALLHFDDEDGVTKARFSFTERRLEKMRREIEEAERNLQTQSA